MNLSIVLPCYNESKNIPIILKRFSDIIFDKNIEIIIVNNGSTDNSNDVLNEIIKKYNFLKVLNIKKNIGYGHGIISGLSIAKGDFLAYTHADLQTDPADLIRGLELIKKQSNPKNIFIKGIRRGRPIFDQFFTIGMSFFESIYLKKFLWDINAQPNIFHKSFFDIVKNDSPIDFSLDLYFLYMAKKNNLLIKRFNVIFPKRIHGKSSWNNGLYSKFIFIKRTLDYSLKLKRKL